MENLYHLIYVSVPATDLNESDVTGLLNLAMEANAKKDVTGMLLFDGNSFFQVLEGDEATVKSLFRKISGDKRHKNIAKVIQEPIEERSFGEWTMGYAALEKQQIAETVGMNDFFKGNTCLADIDEGRALMLLKAFESGQWRLK